MNLLIDFFEIARRPASVGEVKPHPASGLANCHWQFSPGVLITSRDPDSSRLKSYISSERVLAERHWRSLRETMGPYMKL